MQFSHVVPFGILFLFGLMISARAGDNLIENGDFSEANPLPRPPSKAQGTIKVVKNPLASNDKTGAIGRCLEVNLLTDKITSGWEQKLFVDVNKSYRLKCMLYVQGDASIEMGGYSYNSEKKNTPLEHNGRLWQYTLLSQRGETGGWTEFEITIGSPDKSDASLPPDTEWINLGFWLTKGPGKFYFANVSMEEIPK
jgi:hypothetical protein